jgi:PAS domain S-box-containing protein
MKSGVKSKSPTKKADANTYNLIVGGGRMGVLIRSYDWKSTSLGSISEWPQSLLTSVSLMLQSPVPIVMLWGPNGIMLYNDAYSVFAGARHPKLLGSKVVEGWPEVADFNRNVMRMGLSGKTLSYQDQELTLYRHNVAEVVWMDLNYSPIMDESGKPAGVFAIVVETTQRKLAEQKEKQAEDALDSERKKLHSLFMQAPAVIALLQGPKHVFELANPLYMQITGNRPILGKPIMKALPELKGQGILEILNSVYKNDETFIGNEVPISFDISGDGSVIKESYFNFVYQPSHDAKGEVDGILVHAIDVTDEITARNKIEQTLKEEQRLVAMTDQRNELVKLSKIKDEFISLASHQLRTPATAVKQYTRLLIDGYAGPLKKQQIAFLQKAYESNERQLNIINDLLKTAQIDSSQYALQKIKQPLANLIEEVVFEMSDALELKGQSVVFEDQTDCVDVAIDRSEMKLAIVNLLENAIKYSFPDTTILIELKSSGNKVELSIKDTGVGVSEEDVERIFDKFTRVDNELSDTVSGSGLGLYLVKKIVKLHKGTIQVVSTPGIGSTFTMRLPL